ncbi:hypothetical protein [Limosilactobacillus coleohominis]|nr:hypothetical protein [Limosilactobacillus coleohominis]
MIYINVNDETKDFNKLIRLGKITPWDYNNSQIEHEHKLMRQIQLHQERIKQEELYKLQQRKRQRLQEREQMLKLKKQAIKHKVKQKSHQIEDDGPDL